MARLLAPEEASARAEPGKLKKGGSRSDFLHHVKMESVNGASTKLHK